MHSIALWHNIFSEEHTLKSSSNEIKQCYLSTTRQSKRDVLQFLPIISKLSPLFEHGCLPLIIHSCTPPPPPPDDDRMCDHNAMLAFPQEKISYYTTGFKPVTV